MNTRIAKSLATLILTFILAIGSSGCAFLLGAGAVGAAAGGASSVKSSQQESHGAVTYIGTVGANFVYFPAKIITAAGGAALSGLTYLVTLGDSGTSNAIWNSAVGGDYVVTPNMVAGREPVHFWGS